MDSISHHVESQAHSDVDASHEPGPMFVCNLDFQLDLSSGDADLSDHIGPPDYLQHPSNQPDSNQRDTFNNSGEISSTIPDLSNQTSEGIEASDVPRHLHRPNANSTLINMIPASEVRVSVSVLENCNIV